MNSDQTSLPMWAHLGTVVGVLIKVTKCGGINDIYSQFLSINIYNNLNNYRPLNPEMDQLGMQDSSEKIT